MFLVNMLISHYVFLTVALGFVSSSEWCSLETTKLLKGHMVTVSSTSTNKICVCRLLANFDAVVHVSLANDGNIASIGREFSDCQPFITETAGTEDFYRYLCSESASYEVAISQKEQIRLHFNNPREVEGNGTIHFSVIRGSVNLVCDTTALDRSPPVNCPCYMGSEGGGNFGESLSSGINKKFTIAIVSVVVFLIILAMIALIYFCCWKKPKLDEKDGHTTVNSGLGSENQAYTASKPSLNTVDRPEIVNDGQRMSHGMKDSGIIGSTDSGLHSLRTGPGHIDGSLNELSRSQPDIAGRPDMLGGNVMGTADMGMSYEPRYNNVGPGEANLSYNPDQHYQNVSRNTTPRPPMYDPGMPASGHASHNTTISIETDV